MASGNGLVLLIGGEADATTPPDVMRRMQASFSGARLELLAGAGHSAHFEQAAVFNYPQ
ncbi:MAG TPA: alpha/beta hydrolase [Dehalococcoidia bacterium]|nr:alpha/beta hydrolase [Dehalococcoidia bacterium]